MANALWINYWAFSSPSPLPLLLPTAPFVTQQTGLSQQKSVLLKLGTDHRNYARVQDTAHNNSQSTLQSRSTKRQVTEYLGKTTVDKNYTLSIWKSGRRQKLHAEYLEKRQETKTTRWVSGKAAGDKNYTLSIWKSGRRQKLHAEYLEKRQETKTTCWVSGKAAGDKNYTLSIWKSGRRQKLFVENPGKAAGHTKNSVSILANRQ